VYQSGSQEPDALARSASFGVHDGPDEHGRVYKKGGNQVMHFTGLRRNGDCISTSTTGHVCPAMAELLFHRRGSCLRRNEKTLFVYLGALSYLSKVCLPSHALFDNAQGTLWICYNQRAKVGCWGTSEGTTRAWHKYAQ
jgi:hypothetical protein